LAHSLGTTQGDTSETERARVWRLSAAGFMATAVAFGPGRMGFGLFLPIFRQDFALSTSLAGLIASGGFLAFLGALPLTAWLAVRVGQRVPVVAGALAAIAGFGLVATADGPVMLALGIALAGTSAGFCWAPFNGAAERVLPPGRHAGVLSAVATGTTLGVAAAGGLALGVAADLVSWRAAWSIFAAVALVAAVVSAAGLPGGPSPPAPGGTAAARLLDRGRIPLYVTAFVYGVTNAVYLSFAADRVVSAGALPAETTGSASALIFLAFGLFGLLGLATGRMEARMGLAPLLTLIFAAFAGSLVLIALTPGSLSGVMASAGLHGAAVMMISAVLSLWTLRLFPGRSSVGFTAALIAAALGSALGPALAGVMIESAGPGAAFLILAIPAVGVALFFVVRPSRAGW